MWVIGEDRESGKLHILGRPDSYIADVRIGTTRRGNPRYGKERRYFSSPPREMLKSPFFINLRVVAELPEGLKP